MELRDYLRVLSKRWIGILVITLVVTAAVGAYTFTQPRQYTASSEVFIAVSSAQGESTVSTDASYTLQRMQSYLRVVTSPQVLQPVIDELGLDVSVRELAGSVQATNPIDTVILVITAVDADPERAAGIANAVSLQLTQVIQDLETNAAGTVIPVKATITLPAEPPTSPSSPRTRVNLILGLLIGLALGVGYAFLRESLDTSLRNASDLEAASGAALVGQVSFDPGAGRAPLVSLDQSSVRAEAFRAIRTNLQFIDVDHQPRVIALTSALPSEGKTTSSLNLAVTMAQAGQHVVVVESDLRRPRVGEYLGIEGAVGLTDVLAEQIPLSDALLSWNRGLLTVLPAGRVPPNPSELLASHRFAQVLAALRDEFDMVIVDATPLLPVTDGAIVAHACDGAVLVVRHGRTTRDQVAHAVDALDRVDARLLGTVLNFVPTKKRGYGGYGYGYYGYGYGYGYGSEHRDEGKHRRGSRSRSSSAPDAATPPRPEPADAADTRPHAGSAGRGDQPGSDSHAPPPVDAHPEPLPPPGATTETARRYDGSDDTAPQPAVGRSPQASGRSDDTVLPGL